jgi:hypothetical protein
MEVKLLDTARFRPPRAPDKSSKFGQSHSFAPAYPTHSELQIGVPNCVARYGIECAEADKSSHVPPSCETATHLSWCGCVGGSGKDLQMPKGFTVPRSPLGAAALIPPPPWHYAGDVLAVEFWNDPDVAADTLPEGVELDARRAGRSVALFADWQFTAQNDEYLDPARYQCREFIVLVDAMWEGAEIAWCPYAYADNDAALVRGWIQGYPKKIGAVHQTRTFAAASAASAPSVSNGRFAATVSAHGQLLARAQITLRERADNLVGLLDARLWRDDTFRGFALACTTNRLWMSWSAA